MVKRIVEPIVLGLLSNIIVNYIFHPTSFSTSIDEYIVACLLFIPITEFSRFIDLELGKRIDWKKNPVKRLLTHFSIVLIGILLFVNVLGNIYMRLFQNGFFNWREISIINFVSICLAFILTLIQWALQFYSSWVRADRMASDAIQLASNLVNENIKAVKTIEMQKGPSKIQVKVEAIQFAKLEAGTVRMYLKTGDWGIYSGTLIQLTSLLPHYWFFQVARDALLHREAIIRLSSLSFGKILVTARKPSGDELQVTVSRPKAAAFRKWYYSNLAKEL